MTYERRVDEVRDPAVERRDSCSGVARGLVARNLTGAEHVPHYSLSNPSQDQKTYTTPYTPALLAQFAEGHDCDRGLKEFEENCERAGWRDRAKYTTEKIGG